MEKQKTSIFIALVLVLLMIAGIVAWATHDKSTADDPEETSAPESTSEVIITTAEPTETISPEETAEPTATPAPTATPEPQTDGRINQSGSFTSDTGTNLNIIAEWTVVSKNANTLTVTVNVYVQSYSLEIGRRSGTVYINGSSHTFTSSPVTHTGDNAKSKTLVATVTAEVPAETAETVSIPVSVDWNYHGKYSGEEIESISAETVITINN